MKENSIILNDESRIFVSSDWHMYKYDKESGLINKRSDFDEIIKNQNENVSDGDAFIFLGDLVDDQFVNKCMVRDIIIKLKGCHKILVRGNNDVFEDDFYLSSGFTSVVYAAIWDKIVFSHTSIPIDDTDCINIHGHIHRDGWDCNDIPYYHPCNRNINICFSNRKTVCFSKSDNLEEMLTWNNTWVPGKTEKPGMSMFIQNMAFSEFRKYINEEEI